MKISVVNFSGRPNGNCYKIARTVKQALSQDNDILLRDFGALNISPCGRCGYGCFKERTDCPFIGDDIYGLYDSLCGSDLAYYIVPNYCDYPCANFFIFNERGQCYFQNREDLLAKYLTVKKRFIVVSNTDKANFIQAFRYHVPENAEPEVLFLSAKAFGRTSVAGDLTDLASARQAVIDFISS